MLGATLAVLIVSAVAIAGTVWAFFLIADAVDFRLRGYRMRLVTRTDYTVWRPDLNDWLYEEVTADRRRRSFRVVREVITGHDTYPRPSRVYIPNASVWDERTPSWARGRRDEICERMKECFGAHTVFDDVDGIEGRLYGGLLPPTADDRLRWWTWLPPQAFAIPFAVAAAGPWAAIQILSGRWLVGGVVLIAWIALVGALARMAVRRRYFSAGVAVAGLLTVALVFVGILEVWQWR